MATQSTLRPHSIAELADAAEDSIQFNSRYSARSWIRAADSLHKQAASYQLILESHDGGEANERAFMSWIRVAKILLELLPTHPGYKDLSPEDKTLIRERGHRALSSLSQMKPGLSARYEHWRSRHPDWDDQRERRRANESLDNTRHATHSSGGASKNTLSLDESHRQRQRREQEEEDRRLAERLVGMQIGEQRGLQQQQPSSYHQQQQYQQPPYPDVDHQQYQQPQRMSRSREDPYRQSPSHVHQSNPPSATYHDPRFGSLVPNHSNHDSSSANHHRPRLSYPSVPSRTSLSPPPTSTYSRHPSPSSSQPTSVPPPRSTASTPTTTSSSSSPNHLSPDALRPLSVPPSLVDAFLKCAKSNTKKKIETCGLLLGTVSGSGLTVRVLLIPEQKGTSDTCETLHEERVFEFQDKRDLLTLGWIHTHPTQSCFMSSLDLHTHAGYQVMLPEAIAIVVAPSADPDLGIFRLTNPPGLQLIMRCNRKETFHPHPDLPGGIYTGGFGVRTNGFGHVRMRQGQGVEVIDLR